MTHTCLYDLLCAVPGEIELTSHISATQLFCPLPGRPRPSSETSNSRQWKRLNSYLFLKDGQSEKHREVWKRKRYKEPCQTDIAAVESKVGSNVQSLLVILLERSKREGRREMEERSGGEAGCCATESTCYWLFHPAGEATPAPPQLSRQSGTGATGGNLWKDQSPQPRAWKEYVCVHCVWDGVCCVFAHM